MAESFNFMQTEIAQTAVALDAARDGLAQMNATLERQAAEQTTLARAEQQARIELERANHAMNDFLSRVSHELRTPLNAILGFGQLLESGELDAKQRRNTERILSRGRHLLNLINEILEISRLEPGKATLSTEPVELDALILQATDLVAPSAAKREIVIERTDDEPGVWVAADLQRLKQALINLLANAVKYNRDGGRIQISVRRVPDERVAVTVADNGIGIAPEYMDRLFTPFDRLGAERTRVEGTGLGLVLVKQFVEAMGGTVTVDSTPERGTAFTLTLPHAARRPRQRASEPPLRLVGVLGPHRLRVLCIEDNPANLELIESVIAERPHFALITAVQGRLGLQLCEQHEPDLVLLDLHLPDISGNEVLHRLRAAPRTRELPIIVLSADVTTGQIESVRNAGATAYLHKPLDVAEFWRTVDNVLASASIAA